MMTLKAWAEQNGLADVYAAYKTDLDATREELNAEGLPSNGSTYELRVEALERMYPDLFGEDEDDGVTVVQYGGYEPLYEGGE